MCPGLSTAVKQRPARAIAIPCLALLCVASGNASADERLDEITITDGSKVSRFRNGIIENLIVAPEDFGFNRAPVESIAGGDARENAEATMTILQGEPGPKRDIVVMNASVTLMVSGRTDDLKEASVMAREVIDSEKALRKLEEIVKTTQRLAS